MNQKPPLRTYGRIKARTLKPRQAGLMEALLPHLALPGEGAIDVEAVFGAAGSPLPCGEGVGGEGRADASGVGLFERPSSGRSAATFSAREKESGGAPPLILEIGFGGGEHLVAQAAAHPDAHFIGVEPFLNGVASCLRHIEESGVQNLRLHQGDARDVIARLPDACLDLCYILFPDPWPKTRHWKRRLIQHGFLDELARVLKPGAEVRFATDWANYAEWTLELLLKRPDRASSGALPPGPGEGAPRDARSGRFVWLAERADDWRRPWPGHVTTRYEAKKLGDCEPVWLRFVRA